MDTLRRGICYVSAVHPNGWLLVKMDNGITWPIPHYLKVNVTKIENDREYFTILEGRWKGTKASVKLASDALIRSFLSRSESHSGAATIFFKKNSEQLEIIGYGIYRAFTDLTNPIRNGRYDIEIPYEPHPGGASYTGYSKYAKTWFRLGNMGDRFLHPGRVTLGCVTVIDIGKWTEIYNHLIRMRKDERSIGVLTVL